MVGERKRKKERELNKNEFLTHDVLVVLVVNIHDKRKLKIFHFIIH